MFTQWHQIEDWINDNNIKRWSFYRNNPLNRGENAVNNDMIVNSSAWDRGEESQADLSRKLELTRKYLEQYGDRCYGLGYTSATASRGGLFCEVCLTSAQPQQPVGFAPQIQTLGTGSVDEAALTERIKKELRLEYDQRDYERERKQFEDERRQFEADKASVIGTVIGYLKPYLPALQRQVAGLDTPSDIEAARIQAPEHEIDTRDIQDDSEAESQQEPEVFTDNESDKLFTLMARFKKVEPQYLELLESVVTMAENGDSTYTMAKGFLLK